jgi:hypothetical protein
VANEVFVLIYYRDRLGALHAARYHFRFDVLHGDNRVGSLLSLDFLLPLANLGKLRQRMEFEE